MSTTAHRAPPAFAKNPGAWAYTVAKVKEKTGRDYDDWSGKDFGAAGAIYKRVVRKYGDSLNTEPAAAGVGEPVRSRAEILRLDSEVWVLSHDAAWSADDVSTKRLYLQHTLRVANDPMGEGTLVVDPLIVWRVEEHMDAVGAGEPSVITLSVSLEAALWLTRGSQEANTWVGTRSRSVEQLLNEGVIECEAESPSVCEVDVPGLFNYVATAALLRAKAAQFKT